MKNINTIIKKIEELGETSKTVSGVTKNLKTILSEITEDEKQVIMKKLTERRIKYTEKQKNNLTNINFFIANIKCKTKAEINEILKEHKQTRKQEKELKKNNPSPIKKLQTRIQKKKEKKASKKENVTPEIIPIKANEEIRQPKITLVVEPKEGNITEEGIAETISDTLNEEEKIQLKKTIRNKTPKEIDHTLKANKNPMMGKIIKKIAISIGIVTITSGLIRAIWTRAQKDAKNKREYDTEQEVDQKKNDNTTKKEVIIPPPEEKFTTEKIQQSISPDKLQGVSYENIIAAVEKIPDPKIKRQVIDLLKAGDIVGLQQLYSMKINSEYTSNKATGFLDKNTLNKIKNPLFG
ncbi:MAG TPA: hypothetical protein PKC87_02730, partial [Candidatus Absconditabacterales bacterium]|nr:hypothetical protein [Candidatus Absconditabacterales bacterium]